MSYQTLLLIIGYIADVLTLYAGAHPVEDEEAACSKRTCSGDVSGNLVDVLLTNSRLLVAQILSGGKQTTYHDTCLILVRSGMLTSSVILHLTNQFPVFMSHDTDLPMQLHNTITI